MIDDNRCSALAFLASTLAGSSALRFTRLGRKSLSLIIGGSGGVGCLGSSDLAHRYQRIALCISAASSAVRRFSCPQPSSLASASACRSSSGDQVEAIFDGGNPHRQAI